MSSQTPAPRLAPLTWPRAFAGFYRADAVTGLDPVARFLYSARSVILVISVQAAAIAGLLALRAHRFDAGDFVLLVVGLVLAHAVSNLSNDVFGFRRGHDTAASPRRTYTVHPLVGGALSMRELLTGLAVLCAGCLAIAGYVVASRGLPALGFVLAGALLLWAYDAAPVTLKGLALGELASFLVWGR